MCAGVGFGKRKEFAECFVKQRLPAEVFCFSAVFFAFDQTGKGGVRFFAERLPAGFQRVGEIGFRQAAECGDAKGVEQAAESVEVFLPVKVRRFSISRRLLAAMER